MVQVDCLGNPRLFHPKSFILILSNRRSICGSLHIGFDASDSFGVRAEVVIQPYFDFLFAAELFQAGVCR